MITLNEREEICLSRKAKKLLFLTFQESIGGEQEINKGESERAREVVCVCGRERGEGRARERKCMTERERESNCHFLVCMPISVDFLRQLEYQAPPYNRRSITLYREKGVCVCVCE